MTSLNRIQADTAASYRPGLSKDRPDSSDRPAKIDSLFAEVNALAKWLRHDLKMDELPGALLPAEAIVLDILASTGPQTVPQIARARRTSRQNIQIMINRLEPAGFVESIPNPAHKRSVLVALTALGRDRLLAANEHKLRFLQRISDQFSALELQDATGLLRRLNEVVNGEAGATAEGEPNLSKEKKNSSKSSLPAAQQDQSDESELPVNLL